MIISNKIRLFVNVELPSWQTAIHLTTCSRLYSGKWWDYHIYRVRGVDDDGKLIVHSFSSLEYLKKNRNKFYCYYGYNRNYIFEEKSYDLLTYIRLDRPSITSNNTSKVNIEESFIRVPNIIEEDDRIIIYDPNGDKDKIGFSNLFRNPCNELELV